MSWLNVPISGLAGRPSLSGKHFVGPDPSGALARTGAATLVGQATLDALTPPLPGLVERGEHEVKGRASSVRVHALRPGITT